MALGILSLLAFSLRIYAGIQLHQHHSFVTNPPSDTDMFTYLRLAESVAKGEFKGPYYYQPFYYAVFLPTLFKLFGTGRLALIIAQAFLGAATV